MRINTLFFRACRKTFFEKTQCDTPFLSKKEGKTVGRMEKRRQQPVYGHNKAEEASSPKKNSISNDDSLRKMLYLASNHIVKKWTQRYRDWDMVLNHLALLFEDRYAI